MVAAIKPELTTTCWCPGAESVCFPGPEPDAFARPGYPSLSVGPIKISLNVCSFQGTEQEQECVMAINIPPRNGHMCLPFSLFSLSFSPYLNLYLVFILESVLDMNQTLGSNSSRLNVVQLDFKI